MECILPCNSNIKAFYDVILINFNRHAYYFLKCISHYNQCDKSSHRHLWGINWDNFFSGQWVQKIHGQVLNYQYPEVTGYFRNLFATWTWISYRIRYLKDRTEPTLNELAILGGIVVLRTILSVFLNREIKDLEAEGEKEQWFLGSKKHY